MSYGIVIVGSWAAFILVWIAFSFSVKRDIRGGGMQALLYRYSIIRFIGVALVVFVALRIATGTGRATKIAAYLGSGAFTAPPALGWAGAALVVLGVLFAIWARIYLGSNWSGAPAVKEGHELVTSGPYRFVRHPIYAGIILAAFGATLSGTPLGIGVLLIAVLMFFMRMNKEEGIMLELFPNEYPAYRARTKRLIPFVW